MTALHLLHTTTPSLQISDIPLKKNINHTIDKEMTDWQKLIGRKTGWSETILAALRSKEEAEIYIKAGLVERKVAGRCALVQPRIDKERLLYNYRDGGNGWRKSHDDPKKYNNWKDWNNADLMGEGFPPYDKNGDPYELHHIGQHPDSPFAELTWAEHMGDGNNAVLHPTRESEIDRQAFTGEKSLHWKARSGW
jgi:hypothetical protein